VFKKNESESQDQIPDEFNLNDAYPNPFNPETNISFNLHVESNVKIEIYNIIGQVIRKYEISSIESGRHQLNWDGKNQQNVSMPSGIYIMRFVAEPLNKSMNIFQKSIKVTLLR
jgi:flagellar hook assembly protein FlgD